MLLSCFYLSSFCKNLEILQMMMILIMLIAYKILAELNIFLIKITLVRSK